MRNEEKKLKNCLKRKITITMSTIVAFLITGGVAFAATPLQDNATHLITNSNTATGGMTTVAIGGQNNKIKTADGWGEAIVGGFNNEISGAGKDPNGIFVSVSSKIGDFDAQGNPVKELNGEKNETHRSTIIGGQNHIVKGYDNIVLGGGNNNNAEGAVVGGNQILGGDNNAILGGMINKIDQAQNFYYTNNNILGGRENTISDTVKNSSILNGTKNTISGAAENSAVVAGNENTIKNSKTNNGIFAGLGNTIDNANHRNAIIGGQNSKISGTADKQGFDNVIIGGGDSDKGANEIINGDNNTVIGGYKNVITGVADGNYQDDNIILGGHTNSITGTAKDSAILAGNRNSVNNTKSAIIGGEENTVTGTKSIILGGAKSRVSGLSSSVIGGWENIISDFHSVVVGGRNNNISGRRSVVLGGWGNTVSGNGSVAIGGMNAEGTEVEYGNTISGHSSFAMGGKNTISGSQSYALGNSNIINKEKVYILGSNVDASGVANAVVLGDASKAVANAVSVGTEAAPRNIKHVADGVISDTSLDAINGSQVTTLAETGTTFDNKYISVQRDATQEDGADPHIKKHRKYYKIGLTADATTAITNAKKIPTMETNITNNTNSIANKADKNANNLTDADVTAWKTKLGVVADTDTNSIETVKAGDGIAVSGGTEAKNKNWTVALSEQTKTDIKKQSSVSAGTNVESVTSTGTNASGGKEYVVNVKDMRVKSGTISYTDGAGTLTLTSGDKKTTTITGLKDTKVTGLTLADTTLTLKQNNGEADLTVDLSSLKTDVSGKLEKDDINKITSSTLTITGGGTDSNGNALANVAKGDVKIEIANGSIGSTQLDATTNNILNKVGTGSVTSGNANTVTGGNIYKAVKGAKTTVDIIGDYLTINKNEPTDINSNSYKLGLDKDALKKDLATGNITGEGITVEGGDKSTFENVKLSITDKAVTKEKLSEEVQTTLNQVATNKTDIANNKVEIAKKVNTADMNGELTSKSITVTGEGKDKLLKDVNIEVNKTLTGMKNITFGDKAGDTTVSISETGLNNGGNKITNVAAGEISETSTDAVNGSQVYAINNGVVDNRNMINDVAGQVNDLKGEVGHGLATSAAMAGLDFVEIGINQLTMATAIGGYGGKRALAVGVQTAPTKDLRLSAKMGINPQRGHSKTMFSVGASWRMNLK